MPRILIVDDEGQIRTLLSMGLSQAGYQVTLAADGFEAMKLCIAETFDAVLSDINMPRMDGLALVRWIAANRPKVRYALMSALGIDCNERSIAAQCPFLRKPFFPRDAVALVEGMLSS